MEFCARCSLVPFETVPRSAPYDGNARYCGYGLYQQFQPFSLRSRVSLVSPVTFAPGRARLSTYPAATGSWVITNTI